jgi:hypothetical protein
MFRSSLTFFLSIISLSIVTAQGSLQNPSGLTGRNDSLPRVITTAIPFLQITPDARAGGMGDVGAATSPDGNSVHWNPGKLAFLEEEIGFSMSYTPWLGQIIDDMSINYLSGYYKISREQAVAIELRYFDLGNITFTGDQPDQILGDYNPREFAFGATYSRMLVENTLGIGVSARYIHSNLTGQVLASTMNDAKAGTTVAADIGVFYNKDLVLSGTNANWTFAAVISNIGAKVTYSSEQNKEFIPTNFRLGTAFTTNFDPYNSFTIAMDLNKLMVPTPPVYAVDSLGNYLLDADNNKVIARGKDPDRSLLAGMFGSFADAPDGFSEEMAEVMISAGAEYWYNDTFAARAGYFHEARIKGDRKFFTLGLGFRYQVFGIDFAYLVPIKKQHPLAETLRFSLLFNWEGKNNSIRN